MIAQYRPDQVVVEKVFVNVNPASTLLFGQARGAAICAAFPPPAPSEYTALQVKQAVAGKGTRTKNRYSRWCAGAGPPGDPSPDAADALACAICHAHGGQGLGKLATAGYRMRNGRLI